MVKDESTVVAAYDDDDGVTAAFNLNILHRLNRELGADFDLDNFRHRAFWNRVESRIKMHLESTRDISAQLNLHFASGMPLRLHSSAKKRNQANLCVGSQVSNLMAELPDVLHQPSVLVA